MAKIYIVAGEDEDGVTRIFAPTRDAAMEAKKALRNDKSGAGKKWTKLDIKTFDVTPTREGICVALNHLATDHGG